MKNFVTCASKLAIIFSQISSQFNVGTIATKSSPPICPINALVGIYECTHFIIVSAVNLIISSPLRNPYTSLYALKLSKSKYNTEKSSLFAIFFFNSACI